MISIRVVGAEEVLFRLDQIPRQLRALLKDKFESIFSQLSSQFLEGTPGRFLDPKQIKSGVEEQGSLLIGYIEYADKEGVYSIYPTKGPLLINLKQQFFARAVHEHPFPKGAPMIERVLHEAKPWLEAQLQDALEEGIINA